MTSRNVPARSICPRFVTGFQAMPRQSSETIRLPTIWRPETLSSVANCLAVMESRNGDASRLMFLGGSVNVPISHCSAPWSGARHSRIAPRPRIAPSPPPDDRSGPLHPVMLPQIGSPSASASSELFPRLRPPGAKAAAALVPFRPAPDLIVDEDLSRRRRLFRCQPIAVHQRREAIRSQGSLDWGCQGTVGAELRSLPCGQRPGPRGGNSKSRPRRARSGAKRASSVGDSCQGLQGPWHRLQRCKPASHCLTSCGQS
jgi:hypothetical protein